MSRSAALCALLAASILSGCVRVSTTDRAHHAMNAAPPSGARPAIIARGEGEHLLLLGRRDLYITVDPRTVGSTTLMAGLSDIAPGDSIGVHRHLGEDEILFIHRGTVEVRLGDETRQVGVGGTVFIPRGTWIGVRALGTDTATTFFVFNTPAFEKCLRARSVRPGEPYVPLSRTARQAVQRECHEERKAG